MKKIFFTLLFTGFLGLYVSAQNEANIWFFGGGDPTYPDSSFYKSCTLDFNNGEPVVNYIPKVLPFTRSNSSICDKDGNFLCLSNGENIYNRDYAIMENGSNFYTNADYFTGFPGIQGFVLLPFPGHPDQIIHLYGRFKVIYPASAPDGALGYWLRYGVVDMTQNNGLGKVVSRDLIAGTDTLEFTCHSITRHGNGRDWWILGADYYRNIFYRYLLDPSGIKKVGEQPIAMKKQAIPQAVFSPDGNWYAKFSWHGRLPDSTFASIELYPFDRCSGLLGPIQEKTYSLNPLDGKPGGVAFSASSRYMYVSRWDTIFQYDMHAPDILGSEVVVAAFDGFWGDWGNGFTVPQRFYSLMLAPDEKIYCCVSNYNSYYLHVINNPEAAGLACDVQQHAIKLPVLNEYSIPNMPYYRLGKWTDSPCDTIMTVSTIEKPPVPPEIRMFPNPASDATQIVFEQGAPADCTLVITNLTGQVIVLQAVEAGSRQVLLNTSQLLNGCYFVRVLSNGVQQFQHKLLIVRA